MSNTDNNPRAVVGDNTQAARAAEVVRETLERDYAASVEAVGVVLDKARALPKTVDGEEDVAKYVPVVKELRDLAARLEAFRVAEKEPHFRRGQAVDGFFFVYIDKVARRDKKHEPAAADILQERLNVYARRKLAEEQAERDRVAREEQRIAREKQEEAARLAAIAEHTRLEAERARKPETIAAKTEVATQAEQAASTAQVEAMLAGEKAYDAHVDTLAKPADVVRQRVSTGGMLTAGTETFANVVDESKLDKEALWPYVALAEKEKALRAWAKATGHAKTMEGAEIGKRAKGRVL